MKPEHVGQGNMEINHPMPCQLPSQAVDILINHE